MISVVVPIYKVEKYLKKCIDSIINQTYKELEIILVDDGSPDNCGKMCDEFALKDNRIKVIHKENGGLSSARNAGIEIATGEYITFVDSDDYIDNNMYEILLKILKESESDLAFCKVRKVCENEEITEKNIYEGYHEISNEDAIIMTNLTEDYGNYAWNKLYKRSLFEGVRYPVGRVYEDIPVTCQLLFKSKKIVYTEYQGYNYLVNRSGSIVANKKNAKHITDYLKSRKERYEFLKEKCPSIIDYTMADFIRAVNGTNELVYGLRIEELYENEMINEARKQMISMLEKIDKNILNKVMRPYTLSGLYMFIYDEKLYYEQIPYFYKFRIEKQM